LLEVDCCIDVVGSLVVHLLDCELLCMMQEMVSLNIDGHQVQLLPSTQQNVLNVDPSQTDFIQLPYAPADQFQQQLSSVSTVSR